ncbi:wax ester/triacylglycerol synthase family O-acyltransferase [Mycolicibacterium duvalii]|uniref:Diacylglycerol O-acyltransferase n=1 Tax=Mycolicibacterium duvalii TaxID=39688 RepID=A0A7I7JWX3_9MYCO|nr:wax ester/triacylglycerol synthase family O-acyltransferase [Mycolicibacterium duvalii]MCV7369568.1 wax ester/triacylglycerol synthase family O-acyltransferase [Mycolicibacterium duvalii]PEG42193.1 wax ester/triacylglycerol synthase family O-acyltransferase [Mycolicibacterium duvalii]BBX16293.1 diacylglycerol O-acyltransferase [Mycolicibacterium duvalii]
MATSAARLNVTDNSFLTLENHGGHMHVAGVLIFEGPPPPYDDVVERIQARLARVPRYRQKLADSPLRLGRPLWVDDPNFNIHYHLRHTALPAPGGTAQLETLVGRICSQRLDRTKPLWELWYVTGLEDDRFALIAKTHHALVDGIAGVDVATLLLDPVEDDGTRDGTAEWEPAAEPSDVQLAVAEVRDLLEGQWSVAKRALRALPHPRQAVQAAGEYLQGLRDFLGAVLDTAPPSPFNVAHGPHRRVTWFEIDLSEVKRVKNALGGTLNDVVVATVAGGLRSWMLDRGYPVDDVTLQAMVPKSVRADAERHAVGNRIAAMRAPLPVGVASPVERLRCVSAAMADLKSSKQVLGVEIYLGAQQFAPPMLLAQAARLNFSTRLFNLIVTNVPGPQFPLHMLGREMLSFLPIAPTPQGHTLGFGILSYNGKLGFCMIGDWEVMADIHDVADHIRAALHELQDAATAAESSH